MNYVNCKYALFDMDGTLLDSMGCWRFGLIRYIEEKCGNALLSDSVSAEIINRSTSAAIKYYKELNPTDNTPDEVIVEAVKKYTHECYKKGCPIKPGAVKLLEYCGKSGIKTCLFTATPQDMLFDALSAAGIDKGVFDLIFTCDGKGMGKEKTLCFESAMRELGAKSVKDVVIFEDALYSIKTAKSMGIYTVAVYDKYSRGKTDEIRKIADEFYDDLEGFCTAHGID